MSLKKDGAEVLERDLKPPKAKMPWTDQYLRPIVFENEYQGHRQRLLWMHPLLGLPSVHQYYPCEAGSEAGEMKLPSI
jgi:hypothetical protein